MSEIVVPTQTPLPDAIRKVLYTKDNKKKEWTFKGFTEPLGEDKNRNSQRSGLTAGQTLVTGITGTVTDRQGTQSFTIRQDYDFAGGSRAAGGKGYHVNVTLGKEKFAFAASDTKGEEYYRDSCQMLTERKAQDGDQNAAEWFMSIQK